MGIEKIRPMADEVAGLMAARFGGVRRGQHADLGSMLRKRGGALPRRLRREARVLADADLKAGQPKLARQVDFEQLERAHKALVSYLRPLGQGADARRRGRRCGKRDVRPADSGGRRHLDHEGARVDLSREGDDRA
ncbi:hypothetical protein ACFSS8_19765 [Paracoccus kondratievae]